MAHNLRITDGTVTVNLMDTNVYLQQYTPQVSADGGPVRERVNVGFYSSIAAIQSKVAVVNRLLTQAENYQMTETGPRVYAEFDPGASGTYWRSQIYNGRVNMSDELLGGQWGAANVDIEIEWLRQPFWEGALTELTLYNAGTTDTLSGLTINNENSSTAFNYVDLYGSEISGDLPAPVKVEMYNALNTTDDSDEIFIFHNVYSNPSTLKYTLEGESSTGTDVTSTTDATASGAAYAAIAWDSTGKTAVADWTIASTDLDDMAGGRFGIMARWLGAFPSTNYFLQFKVIGNSGALWVGDLVNIPDTRELHLIDTVRMPPYLAGLSALRSVKLRLMGLRNSTDNDINLDYLMLGSISGMSGWKRFKSVDSGVPYQGYFYYDETEGYSYSVGTGGKKRVEFVEYGGPILLTPNVNQRLYFMTCNEVGDANITQTWTIQVWYRPRRSSI